MLWSHYFLIFFSSLRSCPFFQNFIFIRPYFRKFCSKIKGRSIVLWFAFSKFSGIIREPLVFTTFYLALTLYPFFWCKIEHLKNELKSGGVLEASAESWFQYIISLYLENILHKQSSRGIILKRCSLKFRNIHRKTPVSESLCSIVFFAS